MANGEAGFSAWESFGVSADNQTLWGRFKSGKCSFL